MIDLNNPKEFQPIIQSIMEELSVLLKKRIVIQGHKGSGRLIRSIEIQVNIKSNEMEGLILLNDYARYIESGVQANKIPFRGVRGRGGTSKYIQGLFQHWRRLGLGQGEALRAAFATAYVHRREGMPTRESKRFSRDKNGARTGFIGRTVQENEKRLIAEIEQKTLELFNIKLSGYLQPIETGGVVII